MTRQIILLVTAALAVLPYAANAQQGTQRESEGEREARLARGGAGLRLGHWGMRGLQTPAGASNSGYPAFEAWHQRGLDRHISIDNSIAFWGRRQTIAASGGPFSSPSPRSVATFIIPMMTSIQLHPFTGPDVAIEPFIRAGVGLALGIETRQGGSASMFGGSSGTSMLAGVGAQAAGGAAWRLSRAFGVSATAGYRWTHFGDRIGGLREYKGLVLDAGLVYRFQYR